MNIMVAGGLGFIGTNFILYWFGAHGGDAIVNVDNCTYAAVWENQEDFPAGRRYFFEKADIADYAAMDRIVKRHGIDVIVNFAAESHNSYSVVNPTAFYRTNLLGAQTLMEVARNNPRVKRLHHVSTCEVYGDMPLDSGGAFTESSPLGGNSPYSSSKACGNLAAGAYFRTFGTPITVSVCSNNYGPYQFPEKLVPLFITDLMQGKPLTLYAQSGHKREWLHVADHCRAIGLIIEKGEPGEVYNIGSGVEKSIEEVADAILGCFGKSAAEKTYIQPRPSHDRRYLLDSSKIRDALGWEPSISFDDGIKEVAAWYADNERWWAPLLGRRVVEEDWGGGA